MHDGRDVAVHQGCLGSQVAVTGHEHVRIAAELRTEYKLAAAAQRRVITRTCIR